MIAWQYIMSTWKGETKEIRGTKGGGTGAMGQDAFLQVILAEPGQRVRSAPDLEGADFLEILAFEEEVELRLGWGLAFPGGAD